MSKLSLNVKLQFQAVYNYILDLGINENQPLLEQQRIRIINSVLFVTFLLEVILVIQAYLFGEVIGGSLGLLMTLASITPLYLNYKGYTQQGIWLFCLYCPLSLVMLFLLYGSGITTPYSFVIFTIHLIIFLTTFWERFIFSTYMIGLVAFANYFLTHYTSPLARNFNWAERNVIFVVIVIFLIVVLKKYIDLVEKNMKNIADLLGQQTKANQQLIENQATIENQNTKLILANEELEKFAFIASHDLKSPLRNITSFLSLIKRKISLGKTDNLIDDIDYASRASKQMYHLIEDILRFSRMKKQEMSFKDVNLNDILVEVILILDQNLKEKNVEININALPNIEANPSQMILLFQNLIENGVKYNNSTPPILEISSELTDKEIILAIKDNGIGIPMDYRNKVFEMFARLHNQETYEGTGLGLAICRRIVLAHRGQIDFTSSENGTTFFVRLPLKQVRTVTEIS